MQRQPAKRSSLFLLELIIAILFFCLASAVCVRFFVRAHMMEQETTDRNHAVSQASSVAEILRGDTDPDTLLAREFPQGTAQTDGSYLIFYDDAWALCAANDAAYTLEAVTTEEASFRTGQITVFRNDTETPLYVLKVKKYLRKEANER